MTVKELYNLCRREIEDGNGDRDIILCVNENEFHELECGFSSPVYNDNVIYDYLEESGIETDDESAVIILN